MLIWVSYDIKKSFCYLNFFINLMIENVETMKNRRHYGNNNITEW